MMMMLLLLIMMFKISALFSQFCVKYRIDFSPVHLYMYTLLMLILVDSIDLPYRFVVGGI